MYADEGNRGETRKEAMPYPLRLDGYTENWPQPRDGAVASCATPSSAPDSHIIPTMARGRHEPTSSHQRSPARRLACMASLHGPPRIWDRYPPGKDYGHDFRSRLSCHATAASVPSRSVLRAHSAHRHEPGSGAPVRPAEPIPSMVYRPATKRATNLGNTLWSTTSFR